MGGRPKVVDFCSRLEKLPRPDTTGGGANQHISAYPNPNESASGIARGSAPFRLTSWQLEAMLHTSWAMRCITSRRWRPDGCGWMCLSHSQPAHMSAHLRASGVAASAWNITMDVWLHSPRQSCCCKIRCWMRLEWRCMEDPADSQKESLQPIITVGKCESIFLGGIKSELTALGTR